MSSVIRSQTIYIQEPAGITASGVALPTAWVTAADESVTRDDDPQGIPRRNHWTTSHPIWREWYPLLFSATQNVVKDDSGTYRTETVNLAEIPAISSVHSIIFEQNLMRASTERSADARYHTYYTWHLIPLERPIIQPAETEPILDYFQTPTKDYVYSAALDWLPSAVADEMPTRKTGSFEFKFEDSFVNSAEYDYASIRHEIDQALHGKILSITFEDDLNYNYVGIVRLEWEEGQTPTLKIEVECEPFKYGRYTFVNHANTNESSLDFNSKYVAPAFIVVYPKENMESLTINGLARNPITLEAEPIILKNLVSGSGTIVNGERKTVTDSTTGANKFADTDFWEFPSLAPGRNTIYTSSSNLTIAIRSRPRF